MKKYKRITGTLTIPFSIVVLAEDAQSDERIADLVTTYSETWEDAKLDIQEIKEWER